MCSWHKYTRREFAVVILIALVVVSAASCSQQTTQKEVANGPSRVVTDGLDRQVTVPVRVERIVSLAPDLTESIYAAGGGDRLVGVTTFCNYPEEAKAVAKIGDTMNPNIETIIALKPDVVFVSTASQIQAFMPTLESNGIAVYVANAENMDGVIETLTKLGEIFGTEDAAKRKTEDIKTRLAAIRRSVEGVREVRVFVQISKEQLFTIGSQSFLTDALKTTAAISVTADVETAYPKLSKETALALDPDAIILSDSEDNREPNEVFKNSPAVKNGRVYRINADLISRPGPRLVDALEQIAKFLHAEKN